MAEGILRDLAKTRGILLEVDSAATYNGHEGEHPDSRAQTEMKKRGHSIQQIRSRPIAQSDYHEFDRIFVMDKNNLRDVLSRSPDSSSTEKIDLFLNQAWPGKDLEVPDPYFGGQQGFERVYSLLERAAEAFLDEIDEQR
jgi:protein-tyrosine phosphatase